MCMRSKAARHVYVEDSTGTLGMLSQNIPYVFIFIFIDFSFLNFYLQTNHSNVSIVHIAVYKSVSQESLNRKAIDRNRSGN